MSHFGNYHVIFVRAQVFQTIVKKDREKQHQVLEESGKPSTRQITQLHRGVYKAGKLIYNLRKFLTLPAVLVILSSYNTRVRALITSCLERQYAVISKQLVVPPALLNSKFEALSSVTAQGTGKLYFLDNVIIA